jgi:hypothetical protein
MGGKNQGAQLQKAAQLAHTLGLVDRLTTEADQVLDSLGHSLHELTALTAPIHARATALTDAQRNIAATKAAVGELLEHLDTSRRVGCARVCRACARAWQARARRLFLSTRRRRRRRQRQRHPPNKRTTHKKTTCNNNKKTR